MRGSGGLPRRGPPRSAEGFIRAPRTSVTQRITGNLLKEPLVAPTAPLRVFFSLLGCLSMVLGLEVLGGFLPEDPPVAFFYFPFGG